MSAAMKVIKKILLILLGIGLLAGVSYTLLYFHIIKTPTIISKYIPKLSTAIQYPNVKLQEIELQKVKKENDILKRSVSAKTTEMEALQKKIADLENARETDKKLLEDYKNQIIKLNESISSNAISDKPAKTNTYKDMADYFSEMNSKEAADILSRLNDDDVIGILNALKTDVAAELLQKMPRDKADTISRKMLVTSPQ